MLPSNAPSKGEASIAPSITAVVSSPFPAFTYRLFESDTVFRSTDAVFFYVSSDIITEASRDGLRSILGGIALDDSTFRSGVINIPEHSDVLNIVLRTFYKLSMVDDLPSIEDLTTAVDRLSAYGLNPQDYIQQDMPLFDALMAHASMHAIQVYTLAGHYELHELAVRVSPHLLSYYPPDMSDETAVRMGGLYVCHLLKLHMSVVSALKRIILSPPLAHSAGPACGLEKQQELRRAWILAASYLVWEGKPDTSIAQINHTFSPLGDHLSCNLCKDSLLTRVQEVLAHWAVVKVLSKLAHEVIRVLTNETYFLSAVNLISKGTNELGISLAGRSAYKAYTAAYWVATLRSGVVIRGSFY